MCGSWVKRISALPASAPGLPAGSPSQRTSLRDPEEGSGRPSTGQPRPLRGREGRRLRSHILRRRSLGANDRMERGAVGCENDPAVASAHAPGAYGPLGANHGSGRRIRNATRRSRGCTRPRRGGFTTWGAQRARFPRRRPSPRDYVRSSSRPSHTHRLLRSRRLRLILRPPHESVKTRRRVLATPRRRTQKERLPRIE
jgi:hypothetical protein